MTPRKTRLYIFATVGTPYQAMALNCLNSFRHWNLSNLIVQTQHFQRGDTWMHNCLARSIELNKLSKQYPDDYIGMLDADIVCLKQPDKLLTFEGDVAVHDLAADDQQWLNNKSARYSAGVIVFAPTALGRACIDTWAFKCERDAQPGERTREQVYLHDAIEDVKRHGADIFNLGVNYNQPVSDETVIVHHVASRRLRETMGGAL